MNAEDIRAHCISKKGVVESFPFGDDTLVFKVGGKIFLLLALEAAPVQFNAKCDPDLAIELRAKYSAVLPGYHMNKKHWNTVICDGSIPSKKLLELIDHSFLLVYGSLPKKMR